MSSQRRNSVKKRAKLYQFKSEDRGDFGRLWTSGEVIGISGIYQGEHGAHLREKQFFIQRGAQLPPCPSCGEQMHFRLIEKVGHISEDPDFGE